jgi:hypothetical protein
LPLNIAFEYLVRVCGVDYRRFNPGKEINPHKKERILLIREGIAAFILLILKGFICSATPG